MSREKRRAQLRKVKKATRESPPRKRVPSVSSPRKPPRRARPSFQFLDHPADVGFIARGGTLEETFAAAAQALVEFGWSLKTVRSREAVEVRARAATLEDLLYSWLSEILFLCDAEQWVFCDFAVESVRQAETECTAEASLEEGVWEVRATAHGEKFDTARHRPRTYIKAVTYHQLSVKQSRRGWEITVYIDV